MKTDRFAGQNVVITGGSSGIGLETAIQFGKLGAKLFLIARDPARLVQARERVERKVGGGVHVTILSADVSVREQIEGAIREVGEKYGGIHTLVNNAGMVQVGRLENQAIDSLEHVLSVNYLSMVYATRAAWPYLKLARRGHLGFVSSVAGYTGLIGYSAYSPTKFAIAGFAECMRMEAKPHGIGVTVVFPPDTDTPQLQEERKNTLPELLALTRFASLLSPQEVARKFVQGIVAGRFDVLCNLESRLVRIVKSVSPALYFNIVDFLIQRDMKGKNK